MQQPIRGYAERNATPMLTVSDGGSALASQLPRSAEQSLEYCLLETQRQVQRLEEIVHRLTSVAGRSVDAPTGVMTLIQESNRRLRSEVDEFFLDSHAVVTLVRQRPKPTSKPADR